MDNIKEYLSNLIPIKLGPVKELGNYFYRDASIMGN